MKSNTFETALSCAGLFVTLWTVALQVPLPMGFFRQEYQSGMPFSTPGDLPNPEIKPTTHESPALVDGFFTTSARKYLSTGKTYVSLRPKTISVCTTVKDQ